MIREDEPTGRTGGIRISRDLELNEVTLDFIPHERRLRCDPWVENEGSAEETYMRLLPSVHDGYLAP
jgi:hypothetical protein